MSQAMDIYYHARAMNYEGKMPKAIHTLYHALLIEGYKVKKCRKKWFKDHYIITVEDDHLGGFHFHLTTDGMWWECFY